MKRKIVAFLLATLLLLLSGCAIDEVVYNYDTESKIKELSSSVVAENDKYTLKWNDERKYITLTGKQSGEVWSSIPEDFLNSDIKRNKNLEAPLNITVYNPTDKKVANISGFSYAVSSGRVGCEKIDNGIKVTYYFDKYHISIPVSYTLTKDSLDVSLNPKEIVENDFKIVDLSLTPSFCSVKNNTEDSYIFVPSGSGALMECYQLGEDGRTYSGSLYGTDKSRILIDPWFTEENVKMPVFGVKAQNSAMFGIIKSYSGAIINANAGDVVTGFSSVYPSFELRGYDEMETKSGKYMKFSDDISTREPILVSYYLLEGEDAGYEKMASVYREYLIDKYSMEKSNIKNDVMVTFYGGDFINNFVLGVPYKKLSVLTEYSDVKNITEELTSKTGVTPLVRLVGFTENGLSKGKVGGGFKIDTAFGSKKELNNLKDYLEENNSCLFADFDLINFNKSGNGYMTLFSAAKTANLQRMDIGAVTIDVHTKRTNVPQHYLLQRSLLNSAADDLIDSLKAQKLSGVSLDSLGKTAYSDYSETKYYTKGNIANQIAEIITKIKSNGFSTLTGNANDYAAAVSDIVIDVSLDSGDYSVFSDTVPFYQLVFSGYKQLYSAPINEQNNIDIALLDAVSTGTGIAVSIIDEYDTTLSPLGSAYTSKSVYNGNKKRIINAIVKFNEFSEKCGSSALVSYTRLDNGLTKSVYDNDVVVYTNPTDIDVTVEDVTVKSKEFIMKGVE